MKVTFELPSPVVQRLRACVPSGHRSGFLAGLISKSLRGKGSALEQAARKANGLRRVNRDMKDWEALNEHAHYEVGSQTCPATALNPLRNIRPPAP